MYLCIDVGNTSVKVGLFDKGKLIKETYFSSKQKYDKKDYRDIFLSYGFTDIEKICFSSVAISLNKDLVDVLKELYSCEIVFVNKNANLDLTFKIDENEEVGGDLLAALVSVKERFGYPAIICDMGTATKFLVLDKEGHFISCFIVPGIETSGKSLFNNTELLPNIKLKIPEHFFAKNTIDAINNGIIFSHLELVKGIADLIEENLGYKCKRFLTGGYSKYVKDDLKKEYIHDPNLVLEGLAILLKKN